MALLDSFLNFLYSLPDVLIYLLLGLSAFVENVFPPIPGDTITAFGAFLVGTKRLHFYGVYLSTTLGSLTGFMFLFWVGSCFGRSFFIRKDYRLFRAQDIVRAEAWFHKYGYLLILANRFLPGIRSVISIVGGISKLRFFKVAGLALLSGAIWNLIWICMGYQLGSNWETVRERMTDIMVRYNLVILILAGLMVIALIVRNALRAGRR